MIDRNLRLVEIADLHRWLIDGEWEALYAEDRPCSLA